MAWTSPMTWLVDHIPTAAEFNQQIRDNFVTLWPFTAKGDIAYANNTPTTSLSRLAIGAEDRMTLRTLNGVPVWEKYAGCRVSTSPNSQSISSGGDVQIANLGTYDPYDTDWLGMVSGGSQLVIPAGATGLWEIGCGGYWDGHATPNKLREIGIYLQDYTRAKQSTTNDADASATWQSLSFSFYMYAGQTIKFYALQKSGGNLTFRSAYLWAHKVA